MPKGVSNWLSQTETSVPSGAGAPSIVTAPTNTWGSSLLSRSGSGSGAGTGVAVGNGVGVGNGVAVGTGVAVGDGVGVAVGSGVGVAVGGIGVGGVVVRLTSDAQAARTNTKATMAITSFNDLITQDLITQESSQHKIQPDIENDSNLHNHTLDNGKQRWLLEPFTEYYPGDEVQRGRL